MGHKPRNAKLSGKTLRLILGDQLNHNHSWFDVVDDNVTYFMAEMRQETDYARHHIQKVIAFFAAMRAFAKNLQQRGHQVIYLALDDVTNRQTLADNLERIVQAHAFSKFEYMQPDEWRLDEQLKAMADKLKIPVVASDTEHFLTKRGDVAEFFAGKKQYLLESFYRAMRKKHDILMDGDKPVGEQWNYDSSNRKKLPKGHSPPRPLSFTNNVKELITMVKARGVATIGNITPTALLWPINREQSLELLEYFLQYCLPHFGDYQDALTEEHWSVYHSRLSFSLNTKMLSALEVLQRAICHWHEHQHKIDLSQIEGFVRQILGWREYMRGIYWAHMPDYSQMNFFEHERELPAFFWTGETKMNCVARAVSQSFDYAYAHHIQRLMITGNFALLAGIAPDDVDDWYLGIYIDAIEWVEITNTRGMSQFADGGLVGSKPYVSSANYISKMGDHCKNCKYDPKGKTGENACPFNSLYWHFHNRHRDKLERNPRIGMVYRTWDKMPSEKKQALLKRANACLENIENL